MSAVKEQLNFFGESPMDVIKKKWRDAIEGEGDHCPCCNRWGKINSSSITEKMALSLLWLSRQRTNDKGFVDVINAPQWFVRSRSYPALQLWGLIFKSPRLDSDQRSSGLWKVTVKGMEFLKNMLAIPKKVYVYDKEIEGFSSEEIYFRDCFGRNFRYSEVMADQFNFNEIKEK